MLAVVRKPHTKKPTLKIEGSIPRWMVTRLKKEYGNTLFISNETDNPEDYIDVFSTSWHKEIEKQSSPGDNVKIYRENAGMTQEELGRKLGNMPRQNVSAMEKGRRGISKESAVKLSRLFGVPADRFL